MTRREMIFGLGAVGTLAALSGCTRSASRLAPKPFAKSALAPAPLSVTMLSRCGYGPTPELLESFAPEKFPSYVDQQLKPDFYEPEFLRFALLQVDPSRSYGPELRDIPDRVVIQGLQQTSLLRAVYSPWQLREKLVEFWSDHFNIYARKRQGAYRIVDDQRDVIRKHALGNFSEMVMASAKSGAMLDYLDQPQNTKRGPNENYGRELLELHTLGVNGGYTQQDVKEAARCFTGWTIESRFLRPRGRFLFEIENHDQETKTVLGQTFPAKQGIKDGEQLIQLACNHPSTASHLARKLCAFFTGSQESEFVEKIAKIFRESKGDIKTVVKAILISPEFRTSPPTIKRPYEFAVGCLRSLGAQTDGGSPVLNHLLQMGNARHEWPMPDGYPMEQRSWSGTLLPRWNFAVALANGSLSGTQVDLNGLIPAGGGELQYLSRTILGRDPDPMLIRATKKLGKNLPELAALILSSPEYQLK